MAQGAIVFRWGPAVRGRELKALGVFGESVGYWDDMVKNNRVSGHYPYFSTNRTAGFWVIQGEMEDLMAIQAEEDYQRLTTRVQMIVEDYSAELHVGGSVEEVADIMGMYSEVIEELS